MKEKFHSPVPACGSLLKAALFCAAVFFASTISAERADAKIDTRQAVDIAVDALAAAGPVGGVTLGDVEKAVAKGAINCAIDNKNATIESCLREPLISLLPETVRPIAKCLLKDISSIDKNVAGCAIQALSPELARRLPTAAFECLTGDPAKIAECTARAATDPALKEALAQVPPEAQQIVSCIAKAQDFKACLNQLTGSLSNQKDLRDALDWADKLKNDSGTVQNITGMAEGIRDDQWEKVIAHGGIEATKLAAKTLITVFMGPMATFINPVVDAAIDSRVDIVSDLMKAVRRNDLGAIARVAVEFKFTEPVRYLCALAPQEVKDAFCGPFMDFVHKIGDAFESVVNCEVLKGKDAVSDTYKAMCGVVHDAAEPLMDGLKFGLDAGGAVAGFYGDMFEAGGKALGEFVDVLGKAGTILKDCKMSGIISDACRAIMGPLDKFGGLAESVGGAGIDAFRTIFGDPPRMSQADCQEYARRAVQQGTQNRQTGCNFPSNKFHTDFNTHFNWCVGVRKTTAKGEIIARDEMLKKCDTCGAYNQRANDQINQARAGGCIGELVKQLPARWMPGRGHFDACLRNNASVSNSETRERDGGLNHCNMCRDYRNKTEAQLKQAGGCVGTPPLTGGRWSPNGQAHFEWCMQQQGGVKAANAEIDARNGNIGHCGMCQDYRRKTEDQLRQAAANGCVGTPPVDGARWNPNGQAHFDWCMTQTGGVNAANAQVNERNGNLGHCGFCNGYYATTINQIKEAQARGCYPAMVAEQPNWWNFGRGHFVACMGNPAQQSTYVIGERGRMMGRCGPANVQAPSPPPPSAPIRIPSAAPAAPPRPPVHVNVRCANGSEAFSFAQCPKRCPNGQWIPPNAQCIGAPPPQPAGVVCPDNSRAPNLNLCPKRCPDGRVVLMNQQCPVQQPQPVTCPNGSKAFSHAQCPKRCPNGQWIPPNAACPAPPPQSVTCSNGSKAATAAQCPKRCPNGQWVAPSAQCPAVPQVKPTQPVCRMETRQNCPLVTPGSKPQPCRTTQVRVCDTQAPVR